MIEEYRHDPKMKKGALLGPIYALNSAEPKESISDILDDVLIRFFERKKESDPKSFSGVVYKSTFERQTVECEYRLFFCANSYHPEDDSIQKIDQTASLLKDATISPLTRKALENYFATVREAAVQKAEKNIQKRQKEQERKKANKYIVILGVLSLFAMVFLPLVKVSGTPCTFSGIVNAIEDDPDLIFGGVFLILTYIAFFVAIIKYILEPLQMLAMVIGFVIVVGGICLLCGSAYNTSIWLFLLLGGSIVGYTLGK